MRHHPDDPRPLEFEGFKTSLLFHPTRDTPLRGPGNQRGVIVLMRMPKNTNATALSLCILRESVESLRDFCNQWLQVDDAAPPTPEAA
jgi:hypothetical protein